MMRLVVSESLAALEDHLFERLDALIEQRPLGPVAVVVPTGRLRAHLERVILLRRRAYAGIEFLHHHALAERILSSLDDGAPAWSTITPLLLEEITRRAAAASRGSLSQYLARRPAAIGAVLASLRDLRDAGIDANRLRAAGEPGLAEIAARVERGLGRLAQEGGRLDPAPRHKAERRDRAAAPLATQPGAPLLDGAALSRRAALVCKQSAYVQGLVGLIHYGAYDLTGAHRDLIAALAARVDVELLAPIGPAPRAPHGRARIERLFPDQPIENLPAQASSVLGAKLRALYDEKATPQQRAEPAQPALEVFSAQGAEAELAEACRRIVARIGRGEIGSSAELSGIGIVARSLEPYAPYIDRVLTAHGLAYSTSARDLLLRHPAAQAYLMLATVLAEDFPRQPTVELLRSGVFIPLKDHAFEPDRWDRWSRSARLAGGTESWTTYLPHWIERETQRREGRGEAPDPPERLESTRRSLRGLSAVIGALAADAKRWQAQRSWAAHATFLGALGERWLKGFRGEPQDPVIAAVQSALADLAQLDALGGPAPGPREALSMLQRRLEGAALSQGLRVGEGVQVLDMMQARALRFDHLFMLGLNADLWPRRARPDPFLPEEARRQLAADPRCTIALKLERAEEERLLLGLTLDSAGRSLTVSYQRADPLGSAKVPSLAFRELARMLHGDPDPALALPSGAERERVPAHPSQLWRRACAAEGLPAPQAAAAAAILMPPQVRAVAATALAPAPQREALAAGLKLLEAIEKWRDEALPYDGLLPAGLLPPKRPHSPTRLQTYARCPLQYFLLHGLRVQELDDPDADELLPVRELGSAAHRLLEEIYRELVPSLGAPESPFDLEAAAARADELLERHWDAAFGSLGRRLSFKLPFLWNRTLRRWREALRGGIHQELREMAEEHWRPIEFEVELQGQFGAALHGFVDRLDAGAGGRLRVVDYKTRGKLERRVDPRLIRLGEQVQLPVYIELARALRQAEVIGVLLPVGPEIGADQRQDFRFEQPEQRDELRQILEFFDRELEHGHYPLQKNALCNWCGYRGGCRRNHPATAERIRNAPAYAAWQRLHNKEDRRRGAKS